VRAYPKQAIAGFHIPTALSMSVSVDGLVCG